jgi:two-component system chemotaxis response regulator CheY
MQGIDGYEFIRRVREAPEYDNVPIVIISTEGHDVDKKRGFAAGANLYLVKPSDPHGLLDHLRMMLGPET